MARVIRARGDAGGTARVPQAAERGPRETEEAMRRAGEVLRQAELEADRIRAEARGEAARQRSLAAEARAAAEAALRQAGEALEVDVTGLALAVAERILGRAAAEHRELAREMAARALARLPPGAEVTLRVNPADAGAVRQALPELAGAAPRIGRLILCEDEEVGRGGAVAESGVAIADARLEAQLAELERAMRDDGASG